MEITMEKENVFKKIQNIIAEVLNIDKDKIKLSSKIVDDLGAESLDIITLLMEFEDEFNQKIPDEAIEDLITVNDILEYIVKIA